MKYLFKFGISLNLVLICSGLQLYAQEPSKSETIEWIVQKLNDYGTYGIYHEAKFYYEAPEDELWCITNILNDGKFTDLIAIKLKDINQVEFKVIDSELKIKTLGKVAKVYSRNRKKAIQ